jgi:hypothetical protein
VLTNGDVCCVHAGLLKLQSKKGGACMMLLPLAGNSVKVSDGCRGSACSHSVAGLLLASREAAGTKTRKLGPS